MRPATTPSARPHLSGEALDLLLIGALPAAEANAAKRHLDACETCRARWRELNEDKRRFEEHVFARTLPKVEAEVARSGGYPLARPGRPARSYLAIAAALGAAIAAGVVAWGQWADRRPTFELSRARPDSPPVHGGAQLGAREPLRAVVNPGRARYLLLAERDQTGAVTVYFPPAGLSSGRLVGRARLELEPTAALVPGPTTVAAIFSEAPVTIEALEGAVALSADLPGATVVTHSLVRVGDGAETR